ncbi:MAG: hypothetical protein ACK55Z_20060, partial [bacterium]
MRVELGKWVSSGNYSFHGWEGGGVGKRREKHRTRREGGGGLPVKEPLGWGGEGACRGRGGGGWREWG